MIKKTLISLIFLIVYAPSIVSMDRESSDRLREALLNESIRSATLLWNQVLATPETDLSQLQQLETRAQLLNYKYIQEAITAKIAWSRALTSNPLPDAKTLSDLQKEFERRKDRMLFLPLQNHYAPAGAAAAPASPPATATLVALLDDATLAAK